MSDEKFKLLVKICKLSRLNKDDKKRIVSHTNMNFEKAKFLHKNIDLSGILPVEEGRLVVDRLYKSKKPTKLFLWLVALANALVAGLFVAAELKYKLFDTVVNFITNSPDFMKSRNIFVRFAKPTIVATVGVVAANVLPMPVIYANYFKRKLAQSRTIEATQTGKAKSN